ncbi:hypothetical protein [Baekduia sp. Peel2402]|uniref:hypothetical protein n=1 Tax=Baekduia sp. Peel2402 TaxID=3458296 RepID=UPI00403E54F7
MDSLRPSASGRPPRVLCYAPYNRWSLHGRWEMTILQGLQQRGAQVEYVLCDGLYTDCDQFWEALAPRPADACRSCQFSVVKLVVEMGMDFHWLGRYLTPDEGREAQRWAASLADAELLDATYGDWPVGEWMRMSMQSHFRTVEIDLADPKIARTMRSYVFSGLIACFALDRLMDEAEPDVLLLFNGRQSSTRVALELARRRGIRTIIHERGPRPETLMLVENATCLSLEPMRRYWREWGDVPLTAAEAERVDALMRAREQGKDLPWKAFTSPPQPVAEVRARLGLTPARPTWVLFTSSDDEVAGDPDWSSVFGSQIEWIRRTIEHARRHPEIDLVVRVHPNTGSRRSTGANRTQLAEFERLVAEGLPGNVRIVAPDDDVSSYTLMELCAVGLVWVSTVGVELAVKGKEVVVAAGNPLHGVDFARTVEDPARYEELLEDLIGLAPGAASAEIRRRALRLAYGMFIRMAVDFPLVRMTDLDHGALTYGAPAELVPGRDANLDRCARILLDGEAVCPPPSAEERAARDTAAEDALLEGFGARRLTALAFAEEIIADTSLLQAWAAAFDGRDDATLVIHTLAEHAEALVHAVTATGLAGDDGPDLLALEADAEVMDGVDAVFSRLADADALAPPRYDDTSIAALAG